MDTPVHLVSREIREKQHSKLEITKRVKRARLDSLVSPVCPVFKDPLAPADLLEITVAQVIVERREIAASREMQAIRALLMMGPQDLLAIWERRERKELPCRHSNRPTKKLDPLVKRATAERREILELRVRLARLVPLVKSDPVVCLVKRD